MFVSPGSDKKAIGHRASIETGTRTTNRSRGNVNEICRKIAAEKTCRLRENVNIPRDKG